MARPVASPLVIPTHSLPTRGQAPYEVAVDVPAPADLGAGVIFVNEGAPVGVDLQIHGVESGVYVTGSVEAVAHGECVRCLTPIELPIEGSVSELFYEPAQRSRLIADGDEEAEDAFELAPDFLDLTAVVRDAVVLEIPFDPLCDKDCLGLCPTCGVALAEAGEDHHHEVKDPRWAVLDQLKFEEKK